MAAPVCFPIIINYRKCSAPHFCAFTFLVKISLFDLFQICSISCRRQLHFNLTLISQIAQIILFCLCWIFLLFFHWRGISGRKDAHQSHFIGKLVYQGNETNGHPGTSCHPLQFFIFFVLIPSAFLRIYFPRQKIFVWFISNLLDFLPQATHHKSHKYFIRIFLMFCYIIGL